MANFLVAVEPWECEPVIEDGRIIGVEMVKTSRPDNDGVRDRLAFRFDKAAIEDAIRVWIGNGGQLYLGEILKGRQ